MGYGCGVRGHHVQHHVEQELGLELQILALLRYMLECHVLVAEQKLIVVEVSDINIFILAFVYLFTISVQGVWEAWGPWSNCSAACSQGTQSRSRNFIGGKPCTGNSTEIQNCQCEFIYNIYTYSILLAILTYSSSGGLMVCLASMGYMLWHM